MRIKPAKLIGGLKKKGLRRLARRTPSFRLTFLFAGSRRFSPVRRFTCAFVRAATITEVRSITKYQIQPSMIARVTVRGVFRCFALVADDAGTMIPLTDDENRWIRKHARRRLAWFAQFHLASDPSRWAARLSVVVPGAVIMPGDRGSRNGPSAGERRISLTALLSVTSK